MKQVIAAIASLLVAAQNAMCASVVDTKKLSDMDKQLYDMGKAYQPFKNPPDLRSEGGKLETTLTVEAARFEGPVSFNSRLYNGQFPGPTIRIRAGDEVKIKLVNKLGPNIDEDTWVMNNFNRPNTTNIHLHGMHVSPLAPQDDVLTPVNPGEELEYVYSIIKNHNAGTNWYHPHHHGSVACQIAGGLAGAFIVEDDPAKTAKELLDMDEVVAVLQGLHLQPKPPVLNTEVAMSNNGTSTLPVDMENPLGITENMLLVSGQYKPIVDLRPGEQKRIRAIQGLVTKNVYFGIPEDMRHACKIHLFGYDGVYFRKPRRQDGIFIPAGSRADFAVQCNKKGVYTISTLYTDAPWYSTHADSFGPDKVEAGPENVQELIILNVAGEPKPMELPKELPARPKYLTGVYNAPEEEFTDKWDVVYGNATGGMVINGKLFDHIPQHASKLGTKAEWKISSADNMRLPGLPELRLSHPHHQHVNHFCVMNDDPASGGIIFKKGDWRDTISIYEDTPVTIRFNVADFVGPMILHCHVLWHEDLGMMTFATVDDGSTPASAPEGGMEMPMSATETGTEMPTSSVTETTESGTDMPTSTTDVEASTTSM